MIVWDLRTGQRRTLTGHTQEVRAVACTCLDDGTPIAVTASLLSDVAGKHPLFCIAWQLTPGGDYFGWERFYAPPPPPPIQPPSKRLAPGCR